MASKETKESSVQQLGADIRRLGNEVRSLQRELFVAAVPVAPPAAKGQKASAPAVEAKPVDPYDEDVESTADMCARLDEERRRAELKFDQAFGRPFEALPQQRVEDFLHLYYSEIDKPERRSVAFLQKLYEADAVLTMPGVATISGREAIASSVLRKYEGIVPSRHEVRRVVVERPTAARPLIASVTLAVSLGGDRPRKVLQMLEWAKAHEAGAVTDLLIAREVLVAQDARPLYHHSELPEPAVLLPKTAAVTASVALDRGDDDEEEEEAEGSEEDEDDEGDEEQDDDEEEEEEEDG